MSNAISSPGWRLHHLFPHRTISDACSPALLLTTREHLKLDAIPGSNAANFPNQMKLHASVPRHQESNPRGLSGPTLGGYSCWMATE